ncbi:MAG: tol-pal system YbgF family protein [Lewinella sp.]
MSNPNKQDRDGWLRGDEPDAQADEFARHAAQGRKELGSEAEAQDLLNELDGLLAERFGTPEVGKQVTNPAPAAGGAAAGAKEEVRSKPPAKVRRLGRLYAAAAAILLLIAAGSWWLTQTTAYDANEVFAETFTPYANDLSGRTMGDDTTTIGGQLGEALLAYDRRDYPAAVSAFEAHFLAPPTSIAPATAPQIQFYYGVSLLAGGQPQTALPVLDALRTDATYGDPADWYHALALLRDGQTAAVRSSLQDIINDTNSPFQAKATALLSSLPSEH